MSDLLLFFSAFSLALLGGGHCFSMCGALAAYPGREYIISYQLGRLVGYVLLGTVFGFLGETLIVWASTYLELEMMGVTLLFIYLLFQTLSVLRDSFHYSFLTRGLTQVHHFFFQPIAHRLMKFGGLGFFFGLGNALIPCGYFIYFGSLAATSGSVWSGILIFSGLWMGSLPALLVAVYSFNLVRLKIRKSPIRFLFPVFLLVIAILSLQHRITGGRNHSSEKVDPQFCGTP